MKKLFMILLVALLVSTVIIAGCSSPAPAPQPTAPAPASPAKPAASPTAAAILMPWDEWPVTRVRPEWKWPEFFVTNGSSTRFADATALAEIIKKYIPIKTQVVQIGSSLEAVGAIMKGDAYTGSNDPGIVRDGFLAQGDLQGQPPGQIRAFAIINDPNVAGFIARKGSGINSPADFKGKRLTQSETSPIFNIVCEATLQAYGISKDDVKWVKFSRSSDVPPMVRQNQVDVFIHSTKPGATQMSDLLLTKDAYVVGVDPDKIDAAVKNAGGLYPKYRVSKELLGEEKEVYHFAQYDTLYITANLPESLVYAVTRVFWEKNQEFLSMASSIGKGFNSSKAAVNPAAFLISFHPGSLRYYKEIGIWGKEQEALQAKYDAELAERLKTYKK